MSASMSSSSDSSSGRVERKGRKKRTRTEALRDQAASARRVRQKLTSSGDESEDSASSGSVLGERRVAWTKEQLRPTPARQTRQQLNDEYCRRQCVLGRKLGREGRKKVKPKADDSRVPAADSKSTLFEDDFVADDESGVGLVSFVPLLAAVDDIVALNASKMRKCNGCQKKNLFTFGAIVKNRDKKCIPALATALKLMCGYCGLHVADVYYVLAKGIPEPGSRRVHSDVLLRIWDYCLNVGRAESALEHLCVSLGLPMPHSTTLKKTKDFVFRVTTTVGKESIARALQSAVASNGGRGFNATTDGQYHTRGWTAVHCTVEVCDADSHRICGLFTTSKGYNYSKANSSASMEPHGFRQILEGYKRDGIVVLSLTKDGDAKIGKVLREIFPDAEEFSDPNHIWKNTKKYGLKDKALQYALKAERGEYTLKWRTKYVSLVCSKTYTAVVYTMRRLKDITDPTKRSTIIMSKMEEALMHYAPKNGKHSECVANNIMWCPVVKATTEEKALLLVKESTIGKKKKKKVRASGGRGRRRGRGRGRGSGHPVLEREKTPAPFGGGRVGRGRAQRGRGHVASERAAAAAPSPSPRGRGRPRRSGRLAAKERVDYSEVTPEPLVTGASKSRRKSAKRYAEQCAASDAHTDETFLTIDESKETMKRALADNKYRDELRAQLMDGRKRRKRPAVKLADFPKIKHGDDELHYVKKTLDDLPYPTSSAVRKAMRELIIHPVAATSDMLVHGGSTVHNEEFHRGTNNTVTKGKAWANDFVVQGTHKNAAIWNDGELFTKKTIMARIGTPLTRAAEGILLRRQGHRQRQAERRLNEDVRQKVAAKRAADQMQRVLGSKHYSSGAFIFEGKSEDEKKESEGLVATELISSAEDSENPDSGESSDESSGYLGSSDTDLALI